MKTTFFVFVLSIAVLNAQSDHASELKQLALIEKQAASKVIADRILACEQLSALRSTFTPSKLISSLLKDESVVVQINAYRALNVIAEQGAFSAIESENFRNDLFRAVSKETIDAHFGRPFDGVALSLLIEQAAALNSLLFWYPLMSPVAYANWQDEVLGYFARRLAEGRVKYSDDFDRRFLMLVQEINDPKALVGLLPEIVNRFPALPSDKVVASISALWKHYVCGKNGAMNINLKIILKSNYRQYSEKIIKNGNWTSNSERDEIMKWISE